MPGRSANVATVMIQSGRHSATLDAGVDPEHTKALIQDAPILVLG